MNTFFIGSIIKGSTTEHRYKAILSEYPFVTGFNQQIIRNPILKLFDRLTNKLLDVSINKFELNRIILNKVRNKFFDIIWFDKCLTVNPKTLDNMKRLNSNVKLLHYSPDDIMNESHQKRSYLACIPLYDLHVTTKSYNVAELYKLGAKKVLFVNNAYAPEVHKPYTLTDEEAQKYSSDVSFIGGPEKERAESINFIAQNGIKVTVWGNKWDKFLIKHKNIKLKKGWLVDEEYCKIICASKINLAFLRKVNRDLQTTRTMEIPACGGFMLAERTNEHLELFKEDEEAVFFSDNAELKEKIIYYLTDEEKRKKISNNGLKKCLSAGYDNITMIKTVFDCINYER